mmetsp:Transcript_10882/g.30983  ORF Transcript_10882/g.30983 Transcript_10882/m.30983 type:complete len:138 (+) Transcript_10882:653-1066(+)
MLMLHPDKRRDAAVTRAGGKEVFDRAFNRVRGALDQALTPNTHMNRRGPMPGQGPFGASGQGFRVAARPPPQTPPGVYGHYFQRPTSAPHPSQVPPRSSNPPPPPPPPPSEQGCRPVVPTPPPVAPLFSRQFLWIDD